MRRPHLRAVDLPNEPKLRVVGGSANRADAAFTHIWLRGDWIAIVSHQQIWSWPIPLAGEATLLSENWDALPADDGNTVWIQHPSGDRWVRVNGSGSISGPLVVRQPGERLEAVDGQTALVRDGDAQTLRLRRPGQPDLAVGKGVAVCQAGGLAFVRSDLGATLSVIELGTGNRHDIHRSGFGCWGMLASASPDETSVAIGCKLGPAPRPRPPNISMAEWMGHPDNPRSTDDRNIMVLIAVPSLSLTLLDGVFKDFAGTPAWSTAGEGFAFTIPFERHTVGWVDRAANEVRRVREPNQSPVPICDATELIGRGID